MKIIFQRVLPPVALMAREQKYRERETETEGTNQQPGEVGDGGPLQLGALLGWWAVCVCVHGRGMGEGVGRLLDAHVMANKCKKANRKR